MDCYAQIVKPIKHPYGVETLLVNQFAMLVGYITSYTTSADRLLWRKKQSKWVELNLSQTCLLLLAFERFWKKKLQETFWLENLSTASWVSFVYKNLLKFFNNDDMYWISLFFVFPQTRKRKPKGSKGSSNTDGATPNRSKNATTNNNNSTTNNNNNNTVIQDSVNGKQRFSFLLV